SKPEWPLCVIFSPRALLALPEPRIIEGGSRGCAACRTGGLRPARQAYDGRSARFNADKRSRARPAAHKNTGTLVMRMLNKLFAPLLAAVALAAAHGIAAAETIAIIGTGQVASALGPEFAAQGHTIVYGSRNPDRADVVERVERTGEGATAAAQADAAAAADIVVLAVPGGIAEEVVRQLGDLSGKIILDPTNRVGRSDDGWLVHDVPGKGSNAELIQAAAPDARVVK